MDLNIISGSFLQNQTVFETVTDIGIETETVLPDRLGAPEKILKCAFVPRISSKHCENGKVFVSGTGFFRVVYQNSEGKIDSFETQLPFSRSVETGISDFSGNIYAYALCDYINCQALSLRRLEIRGALTLKIRLTQNSEIPFIKDIEGDGIELKKEPLKITSQIATVCEELDLCEEYEIQGEGIGSVIKMNASSEILDSKVLSGKAIIKAEINITAVYLGEESESKKTLEFTLPINKIITCLEAQDTDTCNAKIELSRISLVPKRKGNLCIAVFSAEGEVSAEILREEAPEISVDAYSTRFLSHCESKDVEINSLKKVLTKNQEFCVNPSTDGAEILDVFCDVMSESAEVTESGEVIAYAEISICTLCKNDEGIFTNEDTLKASMSLGANDCYKNAKCSCEITICSCRVKGNSEICLCLCANAEIEKRKNVSILSGFKLDEESPYKENLYPALTLYFAHEGEDIFSIAKHYKTSAKAVMEQNSLSENLIKASSPILIPFVK